mmetsp:Transcript_47361/g.119298  ORF Transcript_47361/g.119298 Transcript_47361/m.119298 type:complete len:345 (-) Transcript_47361:2608-3642(-)
MEYGVQARLDVPLRVRDLAHQLQHEQGQGRLELVRAAQQQLRKEGQHVDVRLGEVVGHQGGRKGGDELLHSGVGALAVPAEHGVHVVHLDALERAGQVGRDFQAHVLPVVRHQPRQQAQRDDAQTHAAAVVEQLVARDVQQAVQQLHRLGTRHLGRDALEHHALQAAEGRRPVRGEHPIRHQRGRGGAGKEVRHNVLQRAHRQQELVRVLSVQRRHKQPEELRELGQALVAHAVEEHTQREQQLKVHVARVHAKRCTVGNAHRQESGDGASGEGDVEGPENLQRPALEVVRHGRGGLPQHLQPQAHRHVGQLLCKHAHHVSHQRGERGRAGQVQPLRPHILPLP